jgi:hypothetical protein
MGQRSSQMLISPIWEISLLRAWRIFFLLWVVLGHFFGFFPSVPIVTPKIPWGVIIKGPLTARKKKYMSQDSRKWYIYNAPVRRSLGVVPPCPKWLEKFLGVFFSPQSGVQTATARAGDLRRAWAWVKEAAKC